MSLVPFLEHGVYIMRTNAVGEIPNQRLWNIAAKQSSEAARSWAVSYCSQFTANASHAPECTT